MILFTLWFGAYGAIATYAGTLAGSGFFASDRLVLHPEVGIIWAIAGIISVLMPLVAFRTHKVDLSLEKRRDLILFFLLLSSVTTPLQEEPYNRNGQVYQK